MDAAPSEELDPLGPTPGMPSPLASRSPSVRIGDRAVALSSLHPGGAITIGGRRHSARSIGMLIEAGAELLVAGADNVGLLVVPAGLAASIPSTDLGKPVHINFVGAVRAEAAAAEERQRRFVHGRRRGIRNRSLAIGLGCGLVAIAVCWMWPTLSWPAEPAQASLLCAAILLGFVAAGPWLAAALEERFGETDTNLRGLTLLTTFLMLLGVAIGGAWAIPRLGVLSGIGVAAIAAVILGSPLPAVLIFAVASCETGPDGSAEAGADTPPPSPA